MIDLLKKSLQDKGVFSGKLLPFLKELSSVIPEESVSEKMKLTLAVNEIILFASQFRKNIAHWNGSKIPINSISFVFSKSGTSKDKSINLLRKTFTQGYEFLNEIREENALENAKSLLESQGKDPDNMTLLNKVYTKPSPLFVAPSTNEGFIQHLNELDEEGIGSGFIYSGEFSSDLNSSSVIIQNLQLISELYDEGKKEVKIIKDKEKQSKEIKNLPVTALFISSPDQILYDESIKKKFKIEFSSKLARRSFFNFNKNEDVVSKYDNIEEFLSSELKRENNSIHIQNKLQEEIYNISIENIESLNIDISVDDEVRELFLLYQRYNRELAETIDPVYPLSKLMRMHLQWKALKLSGAIAFFNTHKTITKEDYVLAVNFTELLDSDMQEFEAELNKHNYELFVDLVHETLDSEGKCFIPLHSLKKLGYLSGTLRIDNKLKELVSLASSYDESGIYKILDKGIEFQKIITTDEIGVSFIKCEGTKEERARKVSQGFKYTKTNFANLKDMLKKDFAYSPFEFKDGIRSNENIISGCKWVALDIDNSLFTDDETHELLREINHHIVKTSDKANPHKFRLLLEFDSFVDIETKYWKKFIESIASYLTISIDILPKSQIFFSYSGREILSVIGKETIKVREHILYALSEESKQDVTTLNKAQKQVLFEDRLGTFSYAYDARDGEGSLSLIRAAKHAKDLGVTREEVLNLMEDINNYWLYPMERVRFENTIINQIQKWSF